MSPETDSTLFSAGGYKTEHSSGFLDSLKQFLYMHLYAHSLVSSDISTLQGSWRTIACQKSTQVRLTCAAFALA